MCLAKVSFILADMFRYLYRRVFCVICINAWNSTQAELDPKSNVITDSHIVPTGNTSASSDTLTNNRPIVVVHDEDQIAQEDNSRVKIPLAIVVGCLIAYTVVGAYIFAYLDGLTWVQGFYYCYVSQATIGNSFEVPFLNIYEKKFNVLE